MKKILFGILILVILAAASNYKPILDYFSSDYKAVRTCIQESQANAEKTGIKVLGAEGKCAMDVAKKVYEKNPKRAVEICFKYRQATWGYKAETACKSDLEAGQASSRSGTINTELPVLDEKNGSPRPKLPKISNAVDERATESIGDDNAPLDGFSVTKKITVLGDRLVPILSEAGHCPCSETTYQDLTNGNKKMVSSFEEIIVTQYQIHTDESDESYTCKQLKELDWKLQCKKRSFPKDKSISMAEQIQKDIAIMTELLEGQEKIESKQILGHQTSCYAKSSGNYSCYYDKKPLLKLYEEKSDGTKMEATDLVIGKPDPKIFEVPEYEAIL